MDRDSSSGPDLGQPYAGFIMIYRKGTKYIKNVPNWRRLSSREKYEVDIFPAEIHIIWDATPEDKIQAAIDDAIAMLR